MWLIGQSFKPGLAVLQLILVELFKNPADLLNLLLLKILSSFPYLPPPPPHHLQDILVTLRLSEWAAYSWWHCWSYLSPVRGSGWHPSKWISCQRLVRQSEPQYRVWQGSCFIFFRLVLKPHVNVHVIWNILNALAGKYYPKIPKRREKVWEWSSLMINRVHSKLTKVQFCQFCVIFKIFLHNQ